VEAYVETGKEEVTLSDSVNEILMKFENAVKEYIENLKRFCRDHADTVVKNNQNVNARYIYEECLWSLRRHAYNSIKSHYEEKLIPILMNYVRDTDTQLQVEKKVYEIINRAVRDLYPSPYPPVRP